MKLLSIKTRVMYDQDPDVSYLEQKGFEERLEQYKNGVFGFVGVSAYAEIVDSNNVIQYVESGSLGGIEDDMTDYIEEVKQEQLEALYDTLENDYGFIKSEVKKVLVEDES